ncbi:reverse transcriptase domain-containing protein, partial [Tanacetum coccineum]
GALPSNTQPNPRADIKAITTRSGIVLDGPSVPPPPPLSSSKESPPTPASSEIPPPPISSELPKRNPHQPPIPYPSRLNKDKLQDKYDIQKLSLPDLTPTRMTLELATRSIAYPTGIAKDVCIQVGKFTFLADFVVVDYDVDPRVPLILGRPFLRTAHALVDVYGEEIILRDGDEKLIFHADSTSKHPHKHGNELINMINFIGVTCEDRFEEVLKIKKSNHPFSGSTTSHYPLDWSKNDDYDDDDLFNLNSDNDEWKKLLYGDSYNNTHPENDKTKDSKTKSLIDELKPPESSVLLPQLLYCDSTFHEELP